MASRRSEIRAERKALKEKEALQNASSGLKHKFTVVDALMYAFIAILSLICLYPFVNVIAYSLSGADAVLANDVTFIPKILHWLLIKILQRARQFGFLLE